MSIIYGFKSGRSGKAYKKPGPLPGTSASSKKYRGSSSSNLTIVCAAESVIREGYRINLEALLIVFSEFKISGYD
jgi:hypothetical protein